MQPAQSVTNTHRVTLQCVLAEMAGQGDRWAQEELLRVYEPLIRSTSLGLLRGCVSQTVEDIQQLAGMALLHLAQTFESGRGAVFTSYVFNYLARKVRRSLDGCDALVHIPAVQKSADRKQLKETGIARFVLAQTTSINGATGSDGEEITSADDVLAFLSPESVHIDNVAQRIDAAKVMQAMEKLKPIDRQVVTLRLLNDLSFNEIGPRVGRTHQGALNAYVRGMARLRKLCGAPQVDREEVGRVAKKRGPRKTKEAAQ